MGIRKDKEGDKPHASGTVISTVVGNGKVGSNFVGMLPLLNRVRQETLKE